MTDPYRKGKAQKIVQHEYHGGWIVWNWALLKWDYFNEKLEKESV